MRVCAFLVLLLLLCLKPTQAVAEELVIAVEIGTTVTNQQARVVLDIANRSNVPVFDIRAQMKSSQFNIGFPPAQQLPAGGHYQEQVNVDIPDSLPGANFLVPVFIEYGDTDGTTITTVALAHFRSAADSPGLFTQTLEPVRLGSGCSETVVRVENLRELDSAISMELVTIPGIAVKPERRSASLAARASGDFSFELCNQLKIPRGQFPYYVIAGTEYRGALVQEAEHSTVDIEVVSLPTRFFGNQRLVSGLAMAALVILFLLWFRAIFKRKD